MSVICAVMIIESDSTRISTLRFSFWKELNLVCFNHKFEKGLNSYEKNISTMQVDPENVA